MTMQERGSPFTHHTHIHPHKHTHMHTNTHTRHHMSEREPHTHRDPHTHTHTHTHTQYGGPHTTKVHMCMWVLTFWSEESSIAWLVAVWHSIMLWMGERRLSTVMEPRTHKRHMS